MVAGRFISPPVAGSGTPVVMGNPMGRPAQRAHGEKCETFRLDGITTPADRLGTDRFHPGLAGNGLEHLRIATSAATHDKPLRARGQEVERLSDGGAGEGRERRRTVFQAKAVRHAGGEGVAVERLWIGSRQIGMRQHLVQSLAVRAPACRNQAVEVHLAAPWAWIQSLSGALAGPVSKACRCARLVDPGDVGDAAEIEDSRFRTRADRGKQTLVVDRRKWGALSSEAPCRGCGNRSPR